MLDKAKNVSKATSSQPSLTTPGPVTATATEITAAAGGSVGTELRASEECQEQTASATTTPSRPRPPVRGQDQPAVTTSVSTGPSQLDSSSDTSPGSKSSSSSDDESPPRRISPTGSQADQDQESSVEEKRRLRRCTLLIDARDQCVYYPSTGAGGEVLAINGMPSIEGHTKDQGYVFTFEKNSGINAACTKRFRMKMFTPWLADSKTLIVRIKTTATQCQQKWLFARDIDVGDKRANLGLMLYEMCETYDALGPEDKFLIECAPNLGFYKADYFLVSQTVQFDLTTMRKLPADECILVSGDMRPDSIVFAMNEDTKLADSSAAQRAVNLEMLRYFDPCQLVVSRAATLLAFLCPYLRESKLLMSLPVVICYGPNNSGKTDRLLVYSACCGVMGGKNKKCSAKGAVEMMGESSLTFIPLDDPEKKVAEEVIEKGFDGSDVAKMKGNQTSVLKMLRNVFMTCKVIDFNQNYHTKVTFCPERPIEKERLEANRDLKMTVERLAVTHGPDAVLHNLGYSKPFAIHFKEKHGEYCKDAVSIIPQVVGEYSRWTNNHALLLMAVKLVLEKEPEWGIPYVQVLAYLKASYPKMVSNLRVYGTKLPNIGGGEKQDVSLYVEKLVEYLNTARGNLKQYLRLTTATRPPLPVLGIKKAVLDKAGLPDFARVMRDSGYQAYDSKNTRFLHEHSDTDYFVMGENPVGKACETTALLVASEEAAFKPLVDLLKAQEKKDGYTTTGKPITEPLDNVEGEMCQKCDKVGDQLWVCMGCKLTVYCTEACQQKDWRGHALKCKKLREAHDAGQPKKKGKGKGKRL